MASQISVEVAYATKMVQFVRSLRVSPACDVVTIIKDSGVLASFPEIDLARNRVGIYGRIVPLNQKVEDGDRIEIYRPLLADPSEIIRKRRTKRGG